MGRQADRTGYVVVDVTNTGAAALSLKSLVFSMTGMHMCASRGYGISTATGDTYTWDATNKNITLANSGVTGINAGFSANYGAGTIHYQVTDAAINEVTQVTTAGALADTVSATATSTKCLYLALGDNTTQLSIAAGATNRYVFMLAGGTSASAVTTLLSSAKTNYCWMSTRIAATDH